MKESSKVVNEDGTPKVLYHGSDAYGFTVFDTVSTNEFGTHFGTEQAAKDVLEYYGTPDEKTGVYKVYLSIQNPLELPDIFGTYFGLNDYIYAMRGENEKCVLKSSGDYDVTHDASTFPENEKLTAYHDYVETLAKNELARSEQSLKEANRLAQEYLKSIGYDDGVAYQNSAEDEGSTSYIVFSPTQIKSATDNIGTFDPENPDIRYSLKTDLMRNRDNEEHPDVSGIARTALQEVGSRYNRRVFTEEVSDVLTYLNEENDPDVDAAMETLTETCRDALSKATTLNHEHDEYVKPVRDYLRGTKLRLTEAMRGDAASQYGSYGAYRKQLFGRVSLTKDGVPLDTAWAELSELNPSLFPGDTNEADMPMVLAAAVEAIKPRYENNFAEDIDIAAKSMAERLVREYFGLTEDGKPSPQQEQYELALRDMPDESTESRTLAARNAYLSGRGLTVGGGISAPNNTPRAAEHHGRGERQFANQTAQDSEAMPDWLKEELLRNPNERYYDIDTNRAQVDRAYSRIQQNGYEASRDHLMTLDRYSDNDTAEANLLMAMAFHNGDAETALGLAASYNKEGTKAGKELQARQLFSKMTPTGAKAFVAGQAETRTQEYLAKHRPLRQDMDKAAEKVSERLRGLPAPSGEGTMQSRWGVEISAQQQALIDHYGLNRVARPGMRYNQATTRQRMLEAILATPNPLELTGNGLTLVQRLEYMHQGLAVVTNADLDYIGTQMGIYTGYGDNGLREGQLAMSRAYEAFGNITPSTVREKARTWRYTSMLLSIPSAIRNVIGNAGQNLSNATAHSIAVELDKAISRITGERTTEHLTVQERADGWSAFVEETKNTFRDYFIDHTVTNTRTDERFNIHQRGRVYQNPVAETMRTVENFLMSVGDRNFWRRAYVDREDGGVQDRP